MNDKKAYEILIRYFSLYTVLVVSVSYVAISWLDGTTILFKFFESNSQENASVYSVILHSLIIFHLLRLLMSIEFYEFDSSLSEVKKKITKGAKYFILFSIWFSILVYVLLPYLLLQEKNTYLAIILAINFYMMLYYYRLNPSFLKDDKDRFKNIFILASDIYFVILFHLIYFIPVIGLYGPEIFRCLPSATILDSKSILIIVCFCLGGLALSFLLEMLQYGVALKESFKRFKEAWKHYFDN